MYEEIERKPVNGREIQNSCNTRSQVMIHLKLVKSEAFEDRYMADIIVNGSHQRPSVNLLHIMKVLIDLVKPWGDTCRTFRANSYFASVTTVDELEKSVLHFGSVVKTDTKKSFALPKLQLPT